MTGLRSNLARRIAGNEHVIRLGRRLLDALEIDHLDTLVTGDPARRTLGEPAQRLVDSVRIERQSRAATLATPLTGRLFDEVLIAIPFLRWAVRSYALDRNRVAALASAGSRDWYTAVAGAIVERVGEVHLREPRWLEPLQELASATTRGELPPLTLLRFLEHDRLPALPPLPEKQPARRPSVVVAIDYPPGFPPTPENRKLIERAVRSLEAAVPATTIEVPQSRRAPNASIERAAAHRQAALSSQIEVLVPAVAGAGTVVAPLSSDAVALGLVLGIPCIGLAPHETTRMETVDFMLRVARRLETPLSVLEPSELELAGSLLPFPDR